MLQGLALQGTPLSQVPHCVQRLQNLRLPAHRLRVPLLRGDSRAGKCALLYRQGNLLALARKLLRFRFLKLQAVGCDLELDALLGGCVVLTQRGPPERFPLRVLVVVVVIAVHAPLHVSVLVGKLLEELFISLGDYFWGTLHRDIN